MESYLKDFDIFHIFIWTRHNYDENQHDYIDFKWLINPTYCNNHSMYINNSTGY